jgi:uncharacterized protein YifE (UPF0438 family)
VSKASNQSLSKEGLLRRAFSDPKNYPYGFSRSGDFSISESNALVEYGCYIAALVDGHILAQSSEDITMLAAVHGDIEPISPAQRAWIKYQKRINRPKTDSIHGSKKAATQEHDEQINDIDDDGDMVFDD